MFKLIQGHEYRCSVCGAIILLTDKEFDDPETSCPDCGALNGDEETETE